MTPVRLEPAAARSRVKHSSTEPLRSHTEGRSDRTLGWIYNTVKPVCNDHSEIDNTRILMTNGIMVA